MEPRMIIEIVGYVGSVLVVVAMLMSSVVKLRIINTIGSSISLVYALIVGAYPLALMNGCLIIINFYNLHKLFKTEKQYDFVVCNTEDAYVNYFVNKYSKDIKTYFPDFDLKNFGNTAYSVFCEGKPAGLLLGDRNQNDKLDIIIDYSTPEYRDCSVGKFIYSNMHDIKSVVFRKKVTDSHAAYMKKIGFEKKDNLYIKSI